MNNVSSLRLIDPGIKGHWSASQAALAIFIALALVLVSACVGQVPEGPVETPAPKPSALPTSSPDKTLTIESSETREPLLDTTTTVSPSQATPTANPKMEAILLWGSYLGLHNNGDNFFLHVVVRDGAYQFEPESIEVIDPATGQSVGPYELHDLADTDLCPWLVDYGRVFVTEGIDAHQLPPVFQEFITLDPRIFRVTVREITGEREVVDIAEIPGVCESTSQ